MARKRIIDTEELYFKAELVKLLGNRGLHLYIRLWGIAEDWGGYEPKYADIALKMGALRFTAKETEKFIGLLVTNKKIIEYNGCGRKVHWIINFMEHQPLDNPSPPKLPLPEWIGCELLEYKSGKKYAKYSIIPEKLPVGYQSATRNGVTNSNSNETKQNSNSKENKPLLSDLDFFKTLKTNPAYKYIDIDNELNKMDAWLLIHKGRQKTRRFIVKWLNRIEMPMEIKPKIIKEEKRPEPINEEEYKKVSKLIHETTLKMKIK
jgi:hypothetical protein